MVTQTESTFSSNSPSSNCLADGVANRPPRRQQYYHHLAGKRSVLRVVAGDPWRSHSTHLLGINAFLNTIDVPPGSILSSHFVYTDQSDQVTVRKHVQTKNHASSCHHCFLRKSPNCTCYLREKHQLCIISSHLKRCSYEKSNQKKI